jgi:mortality factor 4-like protein 1
LYFTKSLGNSLLYKSEYKQFEELKSEYPDKSPADLYGAEHLLRLFGKKKKKKYKRKREREYSTNTIILVEIPNLISKSNIDPDTSYELKDKLERLLK